MSRLTRPTRCLPPTKPPGAPRQRDRFGGSEVREEVEPVVGASSPTGLPRLTPMTSPTQSLAINEGCRFPSEAALFATPDGSHSPVKVPSVPDHPRALDT